MEYQSHPVASETFNAQQSSHVPCFEAWADRLCSFADRKLVGETAKGQTWEFSDWTVSDLQVGKVSTGGEEVVRRPEHVRRSFVEHIALYMALSGERQAVVGDDIITVRPDLIQVVDLNMPSRCFTPHSLAAVIVKMPYSAIGYDPSRHPPSISVSTQTPAGQLLSTAIMTLCKEAARLRTHDAPALSTGFSNLARGLISLEGAGEAARNDVAFARKQLVKAYIEEHLDEPDLDITALCRRFGASRATIYRMFAPENGVANYLRERRLVYAFHQLHSQPISRGRVKSVAESLGFYDHSHFSRLFRNRFHIAPTDAMGLWLDLKPPRRDPTDGPRCRLHNKQTRL